MKQIYERAINEARLLIDIYTSDEYPRNPLESCKTEVDRYQKAIKFTLKRLYRAS